MHFHYKQDPNIYQKLTPSPYEELSMDLNWPSVVDRNSLFPWIAETPSCWQPWCYQHCRRVSWQRLFSWFPVALHHCTPFDQCSSLGLEHFRARIDLQLWGGGTAPLQCTEKLVPVPLRHSVLVQAFLWRKKQNIFWLQIPPIALQK